MSSYKEGFFNMSLRLARPFFQPWWPVTVDTWLAQPVQQDCWESTDCQVSIVKCRDKLGLCANNFSWRSHKHLAEAVYTDIPNTQAEPADRKGGGALKRMMVACCLSGTGTSLQTLQSDCRLSYLHRRRTIQLIHVQWEGALLTGCLTLSHARFSAEECSESWDIRGLYLELYI